MWTYKKTKTFFFLKFIHKGSTQKHTEREKIRLVDPNWASRLKIIKEEHHLVARLGLIERHFFADFLAKKGDFLSQKIWAQVNASAAASTIFSLALSFFRCWIFRCSFCNCSFFLFSYLRKKPWRLFVKILSEISNKTIFF